MGTEKKKKNKKKNQIHSAVWPNFVHTDNRPRNTLQKSFDKTGSSSSSSSRSPQYFIEQLSLPSFIRQEGSSRNRGRHDSGITQTKVKGITLSFTSMQFSDSYIENNDNDYNHFHDNQDADSGDGFGDGDIDGKNIEEFTHCTSIYRIRVLGPPQK